MVKNSTPNFLMTPELVDQMEKHAAFIVKTDDLKEAEYFIRKFWPDIESHPELRKDQSDLYRRLEKILTQTLIIALPTLSEKMVVELFEEKIIVYFKEMTEEFDLWDKLRANLVTLYPRVERNALKANVRQALLRNNQRLTDNNLTRDDQKVPPTIKEWLLDYTSFAGNLPVEAVKLNEYFSQSRNFQALVDKEKAIIRMLITFFERLKLSSNSAEGFEEKVPVSDEEENFIFNEGRWEKIDPKILELLKRATMAGLVKEEAEEEEIGEDKEAVSSSAAALTLAQKEILAAYQGEPKIQQAIAAEEEKLKKASGNDKFKLRDEFMAAVQDKNVNKTMAAFRVLAQTGDLGSFLKEDAKLNKFMAGVWEKKYNKALAAEFIKNAGQPKFVRLFLQYILEERLGLAPSDAARLGAQLGNIFVNLGKKEYNRIAYYDVGSKGFKWFSE